MIGAAPEPIPGERPKMRPSVSFAPLPSLDADWLAVGLFEGEPVPNDTPSADVIAGMIAAKDFAGGVGELAPLHGVRPGGALLVVGLGKRAAFDAGAAFRAGVAVAKKLSDRPRGEVAVAVPEAALPHVSSLVEGLIVGTVGPGLRKIEPQRHPFGSLVLVAPASIEGDSDAIEAAVRRGRIVGEAVNLARELVNLPPDDKTPRALAKRAVAIAEEQGIEAEVWGLERLKTERFGGVMAVAKGSAHKPKFVQLRYRGGGKEAPIALVGKGVTFDSGGLSLKPSASMEDMKCDMAGAATVLATIQAAARLKLPVNVDASFALTENMTGGRAMKLGDVLTMRNGLTVEVLNTDAEGRLILADCLSLAAEGKPRFLIDLATLTGACLVALGTKTAGLFANDDPVADRLAVACKATGERAWRLPLDDDYGDLIKSKVAEIKNVGGKWGGAITAAKFLQRFVGETPWAHLDIAGPAWAEDDSATRDAGGTGAFVRTLVTMLESDCGGSE